MQSKSFEWADFMTKVLQTAGNEIIKLRNELRVEVTYKSAGELVTTADLASDQIIHKAISQCYPEHRILSEEQAHENYGKETYEGPLWFIDPSDGTVNYVKKLSHFAISAAIAVDGVVWAGAVHAPDLGVTYVGVKGGGAYCNSKPLYIHRFGPLSLAIVGTGFPHDKEKLQPALERMRILTTHCRDIRRLAAPAIDICYVASGQLDAHTETIAPWDIAAAGLIAREAGAITGHVGVGGQKHCPIESRYFSGFFVLSVQVLVPSQGQELVPIAVKDKNMVQLPIR